MITSLEQLNSIINQNPIYLFSATGEYVGKYGNSYEIELPDGELIPFLDMQGGYLITYNTIEDLIKYIEYSERYIGNLWDCGDDDFFDNKPDLVQAWYRALYLIKTHNALPKERIDHYIDKVINSIQEVLYFSSIEEVPNDLDKEYKNLELNFFTLSLSK